jgi:hypothetical protein
MSFASTPLEHQRCLIAAILDIRFQALEIRNPDWHFTAQWMRYWQGHRVRSSSDVCWTTRWLWIVDVYWLLTSKCNHHLRPVPTSVHRKFQSLATQFQGLFQAQPSHVVTTTSTFPMMTGTWQNWWHLMLLQVEGDSVLSVQCAISVYTCHATYLGTIKEMSNSIAACRADFFSQFGWISDAHQHCPAGNYGGASAD